jgi:hypothetical protein
MSELRTVSSIVRLVFCLGMMSVLTGCGDGGPELATVTGKVTKAGQPLASISVTFTPVSGSVSSAGLTDAEGKFSLQSAAGNDGAIIGKHKVTLSAKASENAPVGFDAMMKSRKAAEGGKRGQLKEDKSDQGFPAEYGDAKKTPLEYEIKSGSNDFEIAIP